MSSLRQLPTFDKVIAEAEVPLRPVEKKTPPGGPPSGGPGGHGDDPLPARLRGRTGKGRGSEGSGLYPELAAYRISEGSSPNVQAEVGRLVGLLPFEQVRRVGPTGPGTGPRRRCGESPANRESKCWRLGPATCSGSAPGISPPATNWRARGSPSGSMVAGCGCGLSLRRSGQWQEETEEVPDRARAEGAHRVPDR